jgi:hypothetical protein
VRIARVRTALVLPIVLVCVLVAGCGSSGGGSAGAAGAGSTATASTTDCPTSNTTSFAKSKFVLHAGLAFGTFHRYIYKPYKAGTFSKGADGRISALVKAGLTGLFDKREIRLAYEDVQANPTLCKAIAAPLRKLADGFSSIGDKIKGGNTSDIDSVESQISNVTKTSADNGDAITERTDESAG